MVNKHILSHHIDLRLGEQLEEILDDGTGKVKGITTPSGEIIDCQIVGLTAGNPIYRDISFIAFKCLGAI